MNKATTISVCAGLASLFTLVFVFLHGTSTTVVQQTPQDQAQKPYGGLSGPEISSPYVCWGDVCKWAVKVQMAATSSTVCSIQNPTGATSTLTRYAARINTNGIAVAQTVDLATSTTAFGTSTPGLIYAHSVNAGQDAFIWNPITSTTSSSFIIGAATDGTSNLIVGPSQYVNLRIATGTPGTFASYWSGNCVSEWLATQ